MKLKIILFLLVALWGMQAQAQRSAADQLQTNKGPVGLQPILHGSVVLTWDNKTVYVDPYGGPAGYTGIAAPDLILITDIHGDHMDIKTLQAINTAKAKIVAPQAVADMLPAGLKEKVVVLPNGSKTNQAGITITAVPMYNLPEAPDARHPKGRGNGYVVQIGEKNIYFSGDTEDIPEMRALKNIDVAFVCMNLPYTMDINQAAQGVLAFKPKVVYAYHYRGQGGLSDVNAFKKLVNDGNKSIEVRLRNWYPAGEQ
jgi:L-ascorbate metabolism protein UlaG (beta-lactamase superfamily)